MTHAAQAYSRAAAACLFLRAAAVDGSVDEAARTVDFIASTEDIDGHGTIVRQNWRLERFTPQGVVLYAHDHDDLPIGTATCSVEGGQLRARVTFSTEDLNPQAELVFKNVKAGVIRGISPGFMPHTVTFERHDDVEVMVLDDNELFELSVTPCPSNAAALAQYRSMPRSKEPVSTTTSPDGTVTETFSYGTARSFSPPTPPPHGTAQQTPPVEEIRMTQSNQDPTNTVSISSALGLPAGATAQDNINRSVQLRELEVQLLAITGEKSLDGAIGVTRGAMGAAAKLKEVTAELATVKAERDAQNFETLVAHGRADSKLTPAEEQFERAEFTRAVEEGRGASAVERLRGMLKVKAAHVALTRTFKEPPANAGSGSPLLWEGKAYRDLSFNQKHKLSKENPELFRAMKDDFDASESAA